MRTKQEFGPGTVVKFAAWALACAFSGVGSYAETTVTFERLGDLPGSLFQSEAMDVSADGSVVVGTGDSGFGGYQFEGFRWEDGIMTGLKGLREVAAVSDDGSIIVGDFRMSSGENLGSIRWENGSYSELGRVPVSNELFHAGVISGDGHVIVGFAKGINDTAVFRWQEGVLTRTDLPEGNTWVQSINYDGSVMVGILDNDRAFRWESGAYDELAPLPGDDYSEANGVSNDGSVVVGRSADSTANGGSGQWNITPCVWTGGSVLELERLPGSEYHWGEALHVSADGRIIVGVCDGAQGPVIWSEDDGYVPVSVRSILESHGIDLTGVTVFTTNAISADGTTIVGMMRESGVDGQQGYRIRIVDTPDEAQGYELWGMGPNRVGQLGDGTTTDRHAPILIDSGVVAVAAGGSHSIYLKTDGTLMGMGSNLQGQLGDGTKSNRNSPIVIDSDVASISGGVWSTYYVKVDGTLMFTGRGVSNGRLENVTTPELIDTDVTAVSAGDEHVLYIKSDGTMLGMGRNFVGQLGDGTTVQRYAPVVIDTDVATVDLGFYASFYIKRDGTLMAMGNNAVGGLGDGTTTDRSTPVEISSDVVAVATGYRQSLFIKADRSLWGSGNNSNGQLGDGTITDRLTPIEIDSEVIAVAAGSGAHSLYLKSDSTMMGMGSNHSGQLGDGYAIDRTSPIVIDTNVVAVAAGGVESQGHSLYLKIAAIAPVLEILQPPQSYTAAPGSSATFAVLTGGIEGESFEWKHGDTVVGGDSPTFTLSSVQASDAGQYTVTVTAGEESVSSRAVTLGVKAPPYTEKMMNISTRGQILIGTKVMIAGFVLEGSGQKDVLIRGIGPTLEQWVEGTCSDPMLTLFRNTNPATPSIAENDDWGTLTEDIVSITERVGGFPLTDGSKDAVLYENLDPGAYTAKVSGLDGSGVGLVELYDADLDPLASTCNLSNISTRGEVGTQAQILIAGFVVDGDVPKQVLVRGIGPRLADFQVDGTLADPYLRIYKNAEPEALWVASNDNWSVNPNVAHIITTSASVGAFDLVDGSKDAAILTWLEPGTYTAQVSGVDDGTGVALVEVYEVK